MDSAARTLTAVALLSLSGCALGGGVSSPAPTPTPRPTLFAALQADVAADGVRSDFKTVLIADAHGRVLARHGLTPRSVPCIGNAATLMPRPATTAAGAVWYEDGDGSIHRLAPGGGDRVVTRFPIDDPQAELSFAVSPDGRHLMGARITFPPRITPPPDGLPGCYRDQSVQEDILAADVDGAARVVRHLDLGQGQLHAIVLVGWDATGPLATIDSRLGTQNTTPAVWYGPAAHLDALGRPGPIVGGAGCRAQSEADDGAVACLDDGFSGVSVRAADGSVLYTPLPADPGHEVGTPVLSPDGASVAVSGFYDQGPKGTLYRRAGSPTPLPAEPVGWLDRGSLVCVVSQYPTGYGEMELVRVAQPASPVELGFSGAWVGTL